LGSAQQVSSALLVPLAGMHEFYRAIVPLLQRGKEDFASRSIRVQTD
jgi:hypothetical protein